MKKSDLLTLLQDVKNGKVRIDEAITKAETSRKSLLWDVSPIKPEFSKVIKSVLREGWLYKRQGDNVLLLPETRDGKVFQPYYRSIASTEKAKQKAEAKKQNKK